MASTQRWRNLLSQWMSACLAGVITGASLQLEQLTEPLTYKDRSTYMEGCQTTLTLQRGYLLLWSIFSLSEGPQAAGDDGARGTQPATLLLVLLPPAQHLPGTSGSPETETQTSFNAGTREGSALALRHCLEKPGQAGKGLTKARFKARTVTPASPSSLQPGTECQTSGSSCTAALSRASGRAAASLPAEHQLLLLPGLFGTPSLPRGDCY